MALAFGGGSRRDWIAPLRSYRSLLMTKSKKIYEMGLRS